MEIDKINSFTHVETFDKYIIYKQARIHKRVPTDKMCAYCFIKNSI